MNTSGSGGSCLWFQHSGGRVQAALLWSTQQVPGQTSRLQREVCPEKRNRHKLTNKLITLCTLYTKINVNSCEIYIYGPKGLRISNQLKGNINILKLILKKLKLV